jgi:RNA polymerase sigma-B factor
MGRDDPRFEHMLGMQAVAAHWGELPLREQKILVMRFYGEMTQVQIGQQLGMSQMHVSRLIARALGHLRTRLVGRQDHPPGAARPGDRPGTCRLRDMTARAARTAPARK